MAMHVETGTMSAPNSYSGKLIHHLGLVSGMYDELEIGSTIDQLMPPCTDKKYVSYGQAVKAMVLIGLGFSNRALYLSPLFFKDKPTERLIGKGVQPEHLNDDALGRTLAAIYTFSPEFLYSHISTSVVKQLELSCQFTHIDSTGFHTDGHYNSGDEAVDGVIQITKGYSRDHRPDLNQVTLQLICERKAGIPLLMEPLNGNSSDKESFRNTITEHIGQLQTDVGLEYLIADSALYSSETLQTMQNFFWITRVPETLASAKEAIHQHASTLMNDLNTTSIHTIDSNYADIKQRWIVIFSPQSYQRAEKSVKRNHLKQSETEYKALGKLCKQDFSCEKDALIALSVFKKSQKHTMVTSENVIKRSHYKEKGRPTEGCKPAYYTYQVQAALSSSIEEYTQKLERKSCFILATNQLDSIVLTDDDVCAAYKDQQKVERGFRFLKDPMFMASTLFLKSPERIMALMMVMTLCLLVYAALEYKIRKTLLESDEFFPDQKGKKTIKPSARWVFQYFGGIQLLIINQMQEIILNLDIHHKTLLKLLGKHYEKIYSDNR